MKNEFYVEGRIMESETIENIDTNKIEKAIIKIKTLKQEVILNVENELSSIWNKQLKKDNYLKVKGHLETKNNILTAVVDGIVTR